MPAVAHPPPPPDFKVLGGGKGGVTPFKCPTRQSGLADTGQVPIRMLYVLAPRSHGPRAPAASCTQQASRALYVLGPGAMNRELQLLFEGLYSGQVPIRMLYVLAPRSHGPRAPAASCTQQASRALYVLGPGAMNRELQLLFEGLYSGQVPIRMLYVLAPQSHGPRPPAASREVMKKFPKVQGSRLQRMPGYLFFEPGFSLRLGGTDG